MSSAEGMCGSEESRTGPRVGRLRRGAEPAHVSADELAQVAQLTEAVTCAAAVEELKAEAGSAEKFGQMYIVVDDAVQALLKGAEKVTVVMERHHPASEITKALASAGVTGRAMRIWPTGNFPGVCVYTIS